MEAGVLQFVAKLETLRSFPSSSRNHPEEKAPPTKEDLAVHRTSHWYAFCTMICLIIVVQESIPAPVNFWVM
jgi:hypothetical protein